MVELEQMIKTFTGYDKEKPLYVHCRGGMRATVGISILKRYGYHNCYNIKGGIEKMIAAGTPTVLAKCPNSGK